MLSRYGIAKMILINLPLLNEKLGKAGFLIRNMNLLASVGIRTSITKSIESLQWKGVGVIRNVEY